MSEPGLRKIRRVYLILAALLTVPFWLLKLVSFAGDIDWAWQSSSKFALIWNFAISNKGVVVVGVLLLAGFITIHFLSRRLHELRRKSEDVALPSPVLERPININIDNRPVFNNRPQIDQRPINEEEKNRIAKPRLVGRIICLHTETYANTQVFNIGPPMPVDCVISINVSVTNESAMAAVATGFKLTVIVNEGVWSAEEMPVDNCYFRQNVRNVGGGPRYRANWKPLTAFPLNTEITHTTHQNGWLRFVIGSIKHFRVDETIKLRLTVFDHRNEPHEIYDGPITQLDNCGTIFEGERPPSDEF